ncbi:murein transglycosylase A [Roseomonas gilardii]|nr:MltA domain-containing protein [Roseomonas gilardii]
MTHPLPHPRQKPTIWHRGRARGLPALSLLALLAGGGLLAPAGGSPVQAAERSAARAQQDMPALRQARTRLPALEAALGRSGTAQGIGQGPGPRGMVQRRMEKQRQLAREEARARGVAMPAAKLAGAGVAGGLLAGTARPALWSELPGWESDTVSEAMPAVLASCRAVTAGSPDAWRRACDALAQAWRNLPPVPARAGGARLREARQLRDARLRDALEENFIPTPVGEGLLTGYYEPVLRGSRMRVGDFQTPLHAPPSEHVQLAQGDGQRPQHGQMMDGRLQPLPDRAAIQNGALDGRGLELVWVDDPVEAFFLQIQGSGRVVLPDGKMLRLGYAGQNGQPYRSIGRSLIDRGDVAPENMSADAIRRWMTKVGYDRTAALMAENPSYIFFRINQGLRPDQGPPGAMGIPLTPERSIAVDPSVVPLGAPVFVAGGGIRRLVAAQDTGGAIRGPGRGDLFRGWGPEAGKRAGNLREPVRMWVLMPRANALVADGSR